MYTPRAFELTSPGSTQQLIDSYPLGTLVAQGGGKLVATHLPFLLDAAGPGPSMLQAHIARENTEFSRLADGTEVLVVFQGPHAYISPSWYPTKASTGGKAVPTWNYVSVHVHGTLALKSGREWLLAHLERQTGRYEQGRDRPWSIHDAPTGYIDTMLSHIVGLEINIVRIEGKAKLSQNRPLADQQGVVRGLTEPLQPSAGSQFNHQVAALMQAKPDSK